MVTRLLKTLAAAGAVLALAIILAGGWQTASAQTYYQPYPRPFTVAPQVTPPNPTVGVYYVAPAPYVLGMRPMPWGGMVGTPYGQVIMLHRSQPIFLALADRAFSSRRCSGRFQKDLQQAIQGDRPRGRPPWPLRPPPFPCHLGCSYNYRMGGTGLESTMVTRTNLSLALGLAILALTAWQTSPSFAASYAMPAPQGSAIQYVYFDPAAPASPGASGWTGSGKYSLPPDIGAVSVETSAFGSLMTDASGNPNQAFVVRLTIANNGTQPMTIDPAAVQLVDKAGRVLVGARAFSGNTRTTSDTIGPGGKDVLQLEFPLPEGSDIKTLEIEDVDLPYAYGAAPYLARLGFVPAASSQVLSAPQMPAAASPGSTGYPAATTYYTAPYDTSDYAYAYPDYSSSIWWGPSWWWPSVGVVPGFIGDGDFERDDGFFFGRHRGMHDHDGDLDDMTGTGLWKHDKTAGTTAATSKFGKAFGTTTTTGIGGRKGTGNVIGGTEHHSATTLFAPRTTGGVFGSTGNSSIRPMTTTPHNNTSTFFAPRSSGGGTMFSAPHVTNFSAPHVSSFSAPHVTNFSAPRVSSFSAPHVSSFSALRSSGGSFSAPHFSGGGGGGGRGR